MESEKKTETIVNFHETDMSPPAYAAANRAFISKTSAEYTNKEAQQPDLLNLAPNTPVVVIYQQPTPEMEQLQYVKPPKDYLG